jgi:hypothetical protein
MTGDLAGRLTKGISDDLILASGMVHFVAESSSETFALQKRLAQ